MTTGKSPTVRRRRLAAELRALRQAAGKTMTDAAAGANISQPSLSRIERAEVAAKPNDVRALASYLGASRRKIDELVRLASELRRKGWWHAYGDTVADRYSNYIELEAAAIVEYTYEPSVIPGLLQTVDYARAVTMAVLGERAPADDLAAVRLRRQELLTRASAPLRLHVILDETALRRRYGGAQVMRDQLAHLIEVVDRENVTVQVLSVDVADQPATTGPFVLLEFAAPEPPVVYIEGIRNDLYLEESADIDWFRMTFAKLEDLALTPENSAKLLDELASR